MLNLGLEKLLAGVEIAGVEILYSAALNDSTDAILPCSYCPQVAPLEVGLLQDLQVLLLYRLLLYRLVLYRIYRLVLYRLSYRPTGLHDWLG